MSQKFCNVASAFVLLLVLLFTDSPYMWCGSHCSLQAWQYFVDECTVNGGQYFQFFITNFTYVRVCSSTPSISFALWLRSGPNAAFISWLLFHSLSSRKVTQVFDFIAAIAEILSVSDAVNLQSPILNSNCRWSDRKSPPFASQKLRRFVFMALPKQMSLMLYFSRGFAQQMAQRAWNGRMLAVPIVVAVNVSKIIFSCNMWRLKFLIKYSGQFSSKSSSLIVSLCSEKIVDPWS